MADHRDDTRFKWGVTAFAIIFALALILGTIQEMSGR